MTDQNVLDVHVEFGGVSIGEATARLGVRIKRELLNVMAADECFCGHRLDCEVVLGNGHDDGGQMTLVEDLDFRVVGSADVKRIGVSPDQISTGLTFSLSDIEIADLAHFSKGSGRLIVHDVSEIPAEVKDDEEPDTVRSEPPGTLRAEGDWRNYPLAQLFSGAILKSLKGSGLETVGDLSDYSASEQRLTDLEGIGPGKAGQIEDRMLQFWEDNADDGED